MGSQNRYHFFATEEIRMKRIWCIFGMCAAVASCSHGGQPVGAQTTMRAAASRGAVLEAAAYGENPAGRTQTRPQAPVKPAAPAKPDAPAPAATAGAPENSGPAPLNRRLIAYAANLGVGVFEPEKSAMELIAAVEKQGGYLKSRTNSQVVLRIPAQAFFTFIKEMESLGVMTARSIESRDITSDWVESTLRLNNQLVTRSRLQSILTGARNVTETLAVEKEINRVSSEIEQIKGRLRVYGNLVEFAVIQVNFYVRHGQEPITPEPIKIATPLIWVKQFDIVTLFRN